jgi:voltage-gated potassium channel
LIRSVRKLLKAFGLLVLSLIIGLAGFHLIEGYTIADSFFMAVITISTVGYTTIHPLSHAGKVFVSVYIIFNLIVLAYGVSVITSYIFEGGLKNIIRKFKIDQEINRMKNHIIVCGYGRNGSKACSELLQNKKQFVVIEKNQEIVDHISPDSGIHVIAGDATLEEVLKMAKVENASYMITTLPRDSDNVFITLTAKELNSAIRIISRASDPTSEKKLERAGADKVIMPDVLGGLHMAQLITKPYVIEFLDLLNGLGDNKLDLEEISSEMLKFEFNRKTIAELNIHKMTGATVIGYKDKTRFTFNPGPETMLSEGSVMILAGNKEQLEKFRSAYLGGH